MSFEGMDVDQLQGLAKQIDADAQRLYSLVTSLADVLGGLTLLWNGPVAVSFEQDWQSKNRPALLAAYSTLTNLHTHLVSNISQQTSASAADGGWSAARLFGDFENVLTGAGLLSLTKVLAGTPIDRVLDGAGLIALPITAYHMADDVFHVDEDLGQGHYVKAANDLSDAYSDELKTTSGLIAADPELAADPEVDLYVAALYGAGVDVKLLDQVANLDWKDTPSPFSGSSFRQDYLPVFESMGTSAYWEKAGKVLWGDL